MSKQKFGLVLIGLGLLAIVGCSYTATKNSRETVDLGEQVINMRKKSFLELRVPNNAMLAESYIRGKVVLVDAIEEQKQKSYRVVEKKKIAVAGPTTTDYVLKTLLGFVTIFIPVFLMPAEYPAASEEFANKCLKEKPGYYSGVVNRSAMNVYVEADVSEQEAQAKVVKEEPFWVQRKNKIERDVPPVSISLIGPDGYILGKATTDYRGEFQLALSPLTKIFSKASPPSYVNVTIMAENINYGKDRAIVAVTPSHTLEISGGTGVNRALVIANSLYRDPSRTWNSLQTPTADARALKEILERYYHFTPNNIIYIENATRDEIYDSLRKLILDSQENDNVLIFFAGHGYYDRATETGYWIPADAEGSRESTFISNEDIRKRVNQISKKSRHVLLISDACFSGNLLTRGGSGTRGLAIREQEGVDSYYKKTSQSKSCQIITSGGNEYVDDNFKNTGHSPFAYFLLEKLQHNTERYLSAAEIALYLEKTVANASYQSPKSGRMKMSVDALGEFFFVRRD